VRRLYRVLPACLGPRHQDNRSTGRSSGLRLVAIPGQPSPGTAHRRVGVASRPGLWPITAAALRRIHTGFPFHPTALADGTCQDHESYGLSGEWASHLQDFDGPRGRSALRWVTRHDPPDRPPSRGRFCPRVVVSLRRRRRRSVASGSGGLSVTDWERRPRSSTTDSRPRLVRRAAAAAKAERDNRPRDEAPTARSPCRYPYRVATETTGRSPIRHEVSGRLINVRRPPKHGPM
jgi:hypothetical protein